MDDNQFSSEKVYHIGQLTKKRIQNWIEMLSNYSDNCQGNAHQQNELNVVARVFLRVTKDLIQSEDFTDDNIKIQCLKQLKKSQIDEDLINLMLKDFLGLFDIEFPVISLTNFHTLAAPVTDFNTVEKEPAHVEAAASYVKNNLHFASSEKELKSCILPPKHNKASEHHVDLDVDLDDDENEFSVSTDLLAENNDLTPYMATLRIIHVEDWIDENKALKIYNDSQRTQRCDSDLFQPTCCRAKK